MMNDGRVWYRSGFVGLLVLLLLVLGACGQPSVPASVPTNTPEAAETPTEEETAETPTEEEAPAAADDEIRTPEGDIEEFWNSFAWEELTAAEQEAWGVLGWEATSWDEETTNPRL